jgi:HEAT repeat protein
MHVRKVKTTIARRSLGWLVPAACLWSLGLACLLIGDARAADEEVDEDLLQMIVELVSDSDRDMRALGLQQVREEVPGEAASKRFVELLPKLDPDARAGLLEALGERGDAIARPKVLEMLEDKEETVRVAAVRALGGLGTAGEVPVLAKKAASGSDAEKGAARQSLVQLRGNDVNGAVVAALEDADPKMRVELIGVLAARNAKETLPTLIKSADDSDAAVRLAVLEALRYLADDSHAEKIIDILKTTQEDAERKQAELTLLVMCSRGREKCADAIVAGLNDASVPARIALVRALARAGGAKALEEIVARLKDDDEAVRDEAVRMLAAWPDPAVASHLTALAGNIENLRHHVLAIRGLVRLGSPQKEKPEDLALLGEAMKLATRSQEKRLALGALSATATAESLALVASSLDAPALSEEAGLAAVMIAEKIKEGSKDEIRAAMQKVLGSTKRQATRDRAQKVIDSL